MLYHEQQARQDGFNLIIGVDEAGRGPLAGPVVASAVLLTDTQFSNKICDSKKISASKRESAYYEIFDKGHVGVGIVSESVIDTINILQATFWAMSYAVDNLVSKMAKARLLEEKQRNDICLLIDGNRFQTHLPYSYRTIVDGDSLSMSIACASIVAKVTRDRILDMYDRIYPQYGFGQHKGYGTESHRAAIVQHGFSPIHRRTFSF